MTVTVALSQDDKQVCVCDSSHIKFYFIHRKNEDESAESTDSVATNPRWI